MKKNNQEYVWVDDENHFLKGYFKVNTIDKIPTTIFNKIKAFIKTLIQLK